MRYTDRETKAINVFRDRGGTLKTTEALDAGIHPAVLYSLVSDGQVIRLARGLYRIADAEEFSEPDFAIVAIKRPEAVICLVSALAFHGLTTQIPRAVQVAVPRGSYARVAVDSMPMQMHQFAAETFHVGIDYRRTDAHAMRVYGAARTVVDCFKFRNKIGLDIAIEGLREARRRLRLSNQDILPIARLLRQERVMGPYLEAIP
jgi:predicted transcriptional regulator of viral defense system